MGTKENSGKFDCESNAKPNEPKFTLLARDPAAWLLVRLWLKLRVEMGLNISQDEQILEANNCQFEMEKYAKALGKNTASAASAFNTLILSSIAEAVAEKSVLVLFD